MHVSSIISRANERMYYVRACRKANLLSDVGLCTYKTKIRPLLQYASSIWGGLSEYLADDLQKVHDRCLSIIGFPRDTLDPLGQRRDNKTRKELARISNDITNNYNLRSKVKEPNIRIPMSYTERHRQSFIPRAIRLIHS